MDGFVHLHVHSHYSLLDGGSSIKALVKQAARLGMDALALTDHGNLFGAIEFYNACRDAGIKPILGMEAYIAPTSRFDRSSGNISDASYHLLLLAMNETGFRNLMRLSSRAYTEGFYYRPRVDRELLAEFNEGLICTTACLGGEVPTALLSGRADHARQVARQYLEIFGPERFFIEIQNQGVDDQTKANPLLVEVARELGVPLVGTNDVHFLTRDHKPSHEVLCCISTGKSMAETSIGDAYPPELYLKSPQEMRQALARWSEAADNTLRIAAMCNAELDFSASHLPVFATPDGASDDDYLGALAAEGLRRRCGDNPPAAYVERLQRELQVIRDKGYSSYFLIVNDFVQYARDNDIPSAPRGSGVATLLGYVLGIADVDPLKYGLLFERFTDPQRVEAPDIDIDICQEGRAKVIEYVRQKYGHVAQIITYGTLKAKAAIRDVGRVMGIPLPEVDKICKLVPDGLKVTIDSALAAEPDLKAMYDSDQRTRLLLDHARNLEGLARHAGVHAAGVVIASTPLEEIVPLYRQAGSDAAITQWDGPTCDKVGLMKMDFLGLRTLTIIQRARDLVEQQTGQRIDPEQLPLDDAEVYRLFKEGRTAGVFQFESGGMRNVLQQIQPDRIEQIIAANAMYRPGPMELIPTYCARKSGNEPVPSVHPLVDDILEETYGIMAYQEQVMQVLNRLGQLPLNRALTLIKAISKKKEKVIAGERPNFLGGAQANGISAAEAEQLFDLILKFAGYGFNKAHSTRYAIVAYQSAWFKVHYPRQFMAATLTFEAGDSEKLSAYLDECTAMDIRVGPPSVNASAADFTVVGEGILFGLAAIKGVGSKAVEAILDARKAVGKFVDLFHFCENVDLRAVNRATIEAMIKCGAFDGMGAHRAAMTAALDAAIQSGQGHAADRRSGQMNFFETFSRETDDADGAEAPRFPDVPAWTEAQLLKAEKETLGFYITSHPLTSHGRELDMLGSTKLAQIKDKPEGAAVTIGVMISQVRPTFVKKGQSAGSKMAMMTVEDLTGAADAVAFSDTFEQYGHLMRAEAMVFLRGTVDRRREEPSIIVEEVIPMDDAVERLTGRVELALDPILGDADRLRVLADTLVAARGSCPVHLTLAPPSAPQLRVQLRADEQWRVAPTRRLMQRLVSLLDERNVLFRGRPAESARGNGRRSWRQRNGQESARGQAGVASEAVTRFN
ncbi:MAG: DNA polymerase III subunit alpha [Planctomycetes bacterium]|nr:DNA polymerase III subunit alpha [Planctomycetota bacterium]